ncbi:MAG TPA: hypothetical protein VGQ36_21870 [Thermoanaerobaculia bacterium]|jgi:hypothetical protein|nr:hypothetical protein [Thermoanaerobaculia bacterium]
MQELPPALKDEHGEHPVAGAWRDVFREVVRSLAENDYSVSRNVPHLRPVEAETAERMRAYVKNYGATLMDLPEQSWETSVAQWMNTHWEVLVDLWSAQEGRSDLVLHAEVSEVGDDFEVQIEGIWVP